MIGHIITFVAAVIFISCIAIVLTDRMAQKLAEEMEKLKDRIEDIESTQQIQKNRLNKLEERQKEVDRD